MKNQESKQHQSTEFKKVLLELKYCYSYKKMEQSLEKKSNKL